LKIALILVYIFLKLGKSEILPRCREFCHRATMSMPMTAISKNGCALSGQDDRGELIVSDGEKAKSAAEKFDKFCMTE